MKDSGGPLQSYQKSAAEQHIQQEHIQQEHIQQEHIQQEHIQQEHWINSIFQV
jgi:hypothetical protein